MDNDYVHTAISFPFGIGPYITKEFHEKPCLSTLFFEFPSFLTIWSQKWSKLASTYQIPAWHKQIFLSDFIYRKFFESIDNLYSLLLTYIFLYISGKPFWFSRTSLTTQLACSYLLPERLLVQYAVSHLQGREPMTGK